MVDDLLLELELEAGDGLDRRLDPVAVQRRGEEKIGQLHAPLSQLLPDAGHLGEEAFPDSLHLVALVLGQVDEVEVAANLGLAA